MPSPDNRPPENPDTLADWLWYVKRYEQGIFVRETIDGKRDAYRLSYIAQKSSKLWAKHVARMLEKNIVPARVRELGEEVQHETLG